MSETVLQVEGVGKMYRLGEVSTGALSHDINRWLAKVRGKEDPYKKIAEVNDRAVKSESEYVWALQDVNFELKAGEVLGIVGKNGAGKSTLLKILSRITTPTVGEIRIKGRVASLLEVGTGFHHELTGRENIYLNGAILGMSKSEIQKKFDAIVDFAEVERYIDTPVKRYSSGMFVRLAFAVAAFLEPEILVIDEVLAVGDAEFQKKCLGRMQDVSKNEGRTILFVSHNMSSVAELCTKGLLLANGTAVHFGSITDVINKYTAQHAFDKFINKKADIRKPEITSIQLDDDELTNGNLAMVFEYQSPFKLKPPVVGIVVTNSAGHPVFTTNPRMHPGTYNMKSSAAGVIELKIENLPLMTGNYSVSVYFGDMSTDYNSYLDIIQFNFFARNVDNTKVPDVRWVGSLNLSNAQWRITHHEYSNV
ncbi:MAG TPA: ABC transporter ATP-binding protein [Flavisolibacter sp.]|jgi:lipopolysaccharide transport system ATP-binding protein|nr:ABC transporter ATP-binding protein [Flavisolibacter sp.]